MPRESRLCDSPEGCLLYQTAGGGTPMQVHDARPATGGGAHRPPHTPQAADERCLFSFREAGASDPPRPDLDPWPARNPQRPGAAQQLAMRRCWRTTDRFEETKKEPQTDSNRAFSTLSLRRLSLATLYPRRSNPQVSGAPAEPRLTAGLCVRWPT